MNAPSTSIKLRPMTASDHDIDGVLALSQAVEWPHRRDDWKLAQALGHGILAEENDRIIGCAFWWDYGDTFATCGGIIVSPSMQGRGLGRALMGRLLEAAGQRAVLLSATEAGLRLYQSFGFEIIGTAHQYRAQIPGTPDHSEIESDKAVRDARADDLPEMVRIDRQAVGVKRRRLIEEFNRLGSAAVIERDGVIQGFAMCRPFGRGYAVGPVIARTEGDARLLIGHFIKANAANILRVDVTGDSTLGDWLTAQGLPEVDVETLMVRGHRPPVAGPEQAFGLASRSFG